MMFRIYTNVSAICRAVRYGHWSYARWTGTSLVCINRVRSILQMLTHTKNFPLAMIDGTNSQQLFRRVKLILSMRNCKSAGRVHP